MINALIIGYYAQFYNKNIEIDIFTLFVTFLQTSIGIWNATAYGMLLRRKYEWGNYALWSKDTNLNEMVFG